eukprot:PhM_4_TR2727/c0_g1_i2/m.97621
MMDPFRHTSALSSLRALADAILLDGENVLKKMPDHAAPSPGSSSASTPSSISPCTNKRLQEKRKFSAIPKSAIVAQQQEQHSDPTTGTAAPVVITRLPTATPGSGGGGGGFKGARPSFSKPLSRNSAGGATGYSLGCVVPLTSGGSSGVLSSSTCSTSSASPCRPPVTTSSSSSQHTFTKHDIKEVRSLGAGNYGSVTLVEIHNRLYALKSFGANDEASAKKEIEMIARGRHHPNMVKYFKDLTYKGRRSVLLEFVDGCTLTKLLVNDTMTRAERCVLTRSIAFQLILVVDYMHQIMLYHRDLKLDNILVATATGCLKVVDFNTAKMCATDTFQGTGVDKKNESENTFCGSLAYIAPERFADSSACQAKADLWAVGIVLLELVTGRTSPIARCRHYLDVVEATSRLHGHLCELLEGVDADLTDLIASLLNKAPEDRPSSRTLIHHRAFERYFEAAEHTQDKIQKHITALSEHNVCLRNIDAKFRDLTRREVREVTGAPARSILEHLTAGAQSELKELLASICTRGENKETNK